MSWFCLLLILVWLPSERYQVRLLKRVRTCHQSTCNDTCVQQPAQQTGPDVSLLRPDLQEQWHHAKNLHLGSIIIVPGSHLKVWWTCDQCPCGRPHEWMAHVADREYLLYRCPYCCNKKLCYHNSLPVLAPTVASFWDKDRNDVSPDQVMAGSNSRRHWHCSKCGYAWQSAVTNRVRDNGGCPACSKKQQLYKKQPTLAASRHPVMAEFDRELNCIHGLDPDKITLGSQKMVYWMCLKCPKGKVHRWQATPANRIQQGAQCPCCSSRKACSCNSLQTHFPHLAKEWDWEKNDLTPDQVTPRSSKLAFWKTADGRSFEGTISGRTEPSYKAAKRQQIKLQRAKKA